jgi:hypothetical protein
MPEESKEGLIRLRYATGNAPHTDEEAPMEQQTCAEVSFEQYPNPTRRDRCLDELNRVVPWAELAAVITPVYPKAAESAFS